MDGIFPEFMHCILYSMSRITATKMHNLYSVCKGLVWKKNI